MPLFLRVLRHTVFMRGFSGICSKNFFADTRSISGTGNRLRGLCFCRIWVCFPSRHFLRACLCGSRNLKTNKRRQNEDFVNYIPAKFIFGSGSLEKLRAEKMPIFLNFKPKLFSKKSRFWENVLDRLWQNSYNMCIYYLKNSLAAIICKICLNNTYSYFNFRSICTMNLHLLVFLKLSRVFLLRPPVLIFYFHRTLELLKNPFCL